MTILKYAKAYYHKRRLVREMFDALERARPFGSVGLPLSKEQIKANRENYRGIQFEGPIKEIRHWNGNMIPVVTEQVYKLRSDEENVDIRIERKL